MLVRALLAIVWYGVQLYSGSALVANVLRAIFGHSYTSIPNTIPASVGITSAGMLAFFLFWLIHLPFTFFRPYQLRWFFWFKICVMLPAIWGLFIYCMVATKGNIGLHHLDATSEIKSNGWGWFFIWSINSGMGQYSLEDELAEAFADGVRSLQRQHSNSYHQPAGHCALEQNQDRSNVVSVVRE